MGFWEPWVITWDAGWLLIWLLLTRVSCLVVLYWTESGSKLSMLLFDASSGYLTPLLL